ncbi:MULTISPECIES: iron-containing alcohol dehydrogenase [unclassified Marinobacter]|uniref:iron-containing alcohol dehydrogenase n=1 Tax=unclassified Marinobacter TaxID=83889 RepID=UPI001E2893D4|nr:MULTISPECIES: iron-containing alcohol dehydrogenase [unclassified Marinobacter]
MRAVTQVRDEKIDFLLAVGGGSVIDGAKFVAAAALFEGDEWDILLQGGNNVDKALPFGAVLTLPATGSEMNQGAVVTRKMLGHELTALHNLDHAQTLAIVLPSMLRERKAAKQDKLVQYAERVWNITEGSAEQKADAAIDKTQTFFESMGVKTHLVDYQLGEEHIEELIDSLKKNGMNKLGENGDVTPDMCRRVLQRSLR